MPPPYSLQNYVGKHVTSLRYRAALKLKRMVFLNVAALSSLSELLFQYVHRVSEISTMDYLSCYPEEWFWTYYINETNIKILWYTLIHQSFDVRYTFLSHVLWANIHDIPLDSSSLILVLLTLTALIYDCTRNSSTSQKPEVYRINDLLRTICDATKDQYDCRATIMSAAIAGCRDFTMFKYLVSYGGDLQKAKMLARDIFTLYPDIFYPYGKVFSRSHDYYCAGFGTDFNLIPYREITKTTNLHSYLHVSNATRDTTYYTFRYAIMNKNWDLVELGLSMNMRVDDCYALALINGNFDLAVRLYKMANDPDANYEDKHRQLVHSERLIFKSARTTEDVMRFFNFAEVVVSGKEDVGLKAPIQLSRWCTAGAMSTAIFYGTSKRRALVLRELYQAAECNMLTSELYIDPAVYSVLHEAGINFNTMGDVQQTCLHVTKSADTARALLAAGANPNVIDINGENSLGYAVLYANLPFMDVLLHHGSPERTQDLVSLKVEHLQPITCLVTRLELWTFKLPVDIRECDCDGLIACEMLLNYGANLEATDENLSTPLMYAILCGNVVAVKFLLSKGASITAKDMFNFSVFAYCGRSIHFTDRTIEIADLLLSYTIEKYANKYAVEKYKLQDDIMCNLHTNWLHHDRQERPWCNLNSTSFPVPDDVIKYRADRVVDYISNYDVNILLLPHF